MFIPFSYCAVKIVFLWLQLLVSKRARVPLGDGFTARRIAGPGLAGAYFYQIRTEQALFALETKMELDQLRAYKVILWYLTMYPKNESALL